MSTLSGLLLAFQASLNAEKVFTKSERVLGRLHFRKVVGWLGKWPMVIATSEVRPLNSWGLFLVLPQRDALGTQQKETGRFFGKKGGWMEGSK